MLFAFTYPDANAVTIDWAAVRSHVHRAIAAIAPNDSEARYRALGAAVFREHARFVAPDTLEVGGNRITARRIVIAAGSRAVPVAADVKA